MTNKLEQAARQALEALEKTGIEGTWLLHDEAITVLREALAEQAEQEPVAWVVYTEGGDAIDCICSEKPRLNKEQYTIPLYAAPVRTKDLTDDEIDAIEIITDRQFARAVIAADREKNRE